MTWTCDLCMTECDYAPQHLRRSGHDGLWRPTRVINTSLAARRAFVLAQITGQARQTVGKTREDRIADGLVRACHTCVSNRDWRGHSPARGQMLPGSGFSS